ncbi:putative RNA-dependent RNA polymerase, eukaryotic-type [Medicago truncatula]|uniref:Putative RNA-dependent RNA polymerase, eukaryotic-type n=1 Tax=Medicago truncatula TaxID=3880 RepID=A0A396J7M7_MEDTR|nr:probable RNA-dependent RNA polymerase 5 [Medicago truncatula]RHN74236.1 putative RNA-dependent RNA polymerase, eukaryotic-type [Medicago truncatula]
MVKILPRLTEDPGSVQSRRTITMNMSQFDGNATFTGGGFMPSQTTQGANSPFTPSKGLNRSYLSKYLIALLSYGGVPNEFFTDVLKRNLEDVDHIYTKKCTALRGRNPP